MLTITINEDCEDELVLPAKREVCSRCRGTGTHTNPAIDGNGITSSEMDELGDDFRDNYMAGVYDVRCEECHGNNVVIVVDRDRCTSEQLAAVDDYYREMAQMYAMDRQERMMGA